VDEASQEIARHLRWSSIGYWILVIGLIGDIIVVFIERYALPKKYSPWEPQRRLTRFRRFLSRNEIRLAVFFIIVVIIGVAVEHDNDAALSVLVTQQEREARLQTAKFQHLVGGREFIDDDALAKLDRFAGTKIWLQLARISTDQNAPIREMDSQMAARNEISNFARSFRALRKWRIDLLPDTLTGSGMIGLHVYSDRTRQGKVITDWKGISPYEIPLDTPEEEGWAAAEALTRYFRDDLGLTEVEHWPRDFAGAEQAASWSDLPPDQIIVQIGERTTSEIQDETIGITK
jgi:hypothetical protein